MADASASWHAPAPMPRRPARAARNARNTSGRRGCPQAALRAGRSRVIGRARGADAGEFSVRFHVCDGRVRDVSLRRDPTSLSGSQVRPSANGRDRLGGRLRRRQGCGRRRVRLGRRRRRREVRAVVASTAPGDEREPHETQSRSRPHDALDAGRYAKRGSAGRGGEGGGSNGSPSPKRRGSACTSCPTRTSTGRCDRCPCARSRQVPARTTSARAERPAQSRRLRRPR